MKGVIFKRLKEKGRKKGVKKEARQAKLADRQRRIQQEAERIVQARVDQGELAVLGQEGNATRAVAKVANPASKDSDRKRAHSTQQQEGPPKKTVRRQSNELFLKEIRPDQITRTDVQQWKLWFVLPGIIQGHTHQRRASSEAAST